MVNCDFTLLSVLFSSNVVSKHQDGNSKKKNSSRDFEMGPHKQVDDFMVATFTLYTACTTLN